MEPTERGAGALDHDLCRYGTSRLRFRAQGRGLTDNYIAVIGGAETFGRHVEAPFADLLEQALGLRCVNLGVAGAGPGAFLDDPGVIAICAGARLTVIQLGGVQNVGNRFYAVHPRRNDRLIRPTGMMRAVFPEVDFTIFHFTRHMLEHLHRVSPRRFGMIRDELRRAWVAGMNRLTARIGGPIVLAWIGDRGPADPGDTTFDGDPLFLTARMMADLRGRIHGLAEVLDISRSEDEALEGKRYDLAEIGAALRLPGPRAHGALAAELARMISPLLAPGADPMLERVARLG